MSPRSFSKPVSGLILIMLLMPVLAVGIDTGQQTYAAPEPPVPAVAGYEGTLYTGQLHNHAGEYGDDGTGTVEANLAYMKGTADPAFQFGGLSPHSHMLTDSGMLSYWGDMAPYTDAGFVGIHAQEWSSLSSSNHVNVYLGSERCAVANGDIPGFYSWLDTSGGYGSFNHPGYGSDMNNWQYYPSVDKPGNFAGKMIMMEMDKTPGSDSDFPDYLLALSKGWHIGISVSDDNHGGDPGDMYANRPRTGMWLESLTPGGVEAAFQELRFFGSQLVDGYIDIEAGGHTMGDVFTGSSGTLLTAMLNPSYSYSSVEIFIDGAGHTMTQLDAGHYTYTIDASQSHYYFVRAAEYESGSYIISSPIWTGGGEPVPETPEPPTNVTAELSGPDVVVRWDLSPDDAAGTSMASFEPGEDAQVVSGYPSNNYGSVDYMYVQSDVSTVYLNERSWLKFNLAGQIPADADITAASLSLYCYKANGANMDATAHQVDTDSWTEGGITWNSQPFYGAGLDTVSLQVGVIGVRYEWDVTSFAQSQWSGDKVMSLVVKPSIESSPTTQTYAFEASENPDTAVRPRLMIWYTSAVSGIHYEVYRGTSYDPSGSGYSYVGQSPSLSTSYIDTGRGDGNPIDYYYSVRAVNLASEYGIATTQAAKIVTFTQSGWNLLSVPILADNRTVESTLQTLAWDCALYYDTTDAADHWKSNIPSRTPGFTTIDRTVGFWVHSLSADTFITAGQVPSSTAIPLSVGWNLVGYPALSQLSISEALAGTGYDLPVEKCNTAAPGLLEQLPDTYLMAPGEGYWVHVPANMLWIVDW